MRKRQGMSARASAIHADQERWETNRLKTSGVVETTGLDLDFDDEADERVTLMVHNARPPFLDGRVVFSTQMQARGSRNLRLWL